MESTQIVSSTNSFPRRPERVGKMMGQELKLFSNYF